MGGVVKRFELPPVYLPQRDEGLHPFQRDILEFASGSDPGSIAFVHAPTGAGKTYVLRDLVSSINPNQDLGMLYCTPTNALASQVKADLEEAAGGPVYRWTAADFTSYGVQRQKDMIDESETASAIISNPDLLHLFTQNHYVSPVAHRDDPARAKWLQQQRVRLFDFAQMHLGLHFFDEYHIYDERLLGSILLYLRKCRNLGLPHRYIFMSATPQPKMKQLLAEVVPDADLAEILGIQSSEQAEDSRLVKGSLDVSVRNDSILRSLPAEVPEERTMYVFSTKRQEHEAARILLNRGIQRGDEGFVEITGAETTSSRGQMEWDEAPILLGTSKVDVGLDIGDLDRLVMEPGWSQEQFQQRLGRIGRGSEGVVALHFEGYDPQVLKSLKGPTRGELQDQISGFLRKNRLHGDTALRFLGSNAAVFEHSTNRGAVHDSVKSDALPAKAKQARDLLRKMIREVDEAGLTSQESVTHDWLERVLDSLGGLRGSRLEIEVQYRWREDTVREDLLWVVSHTYPDPELDREGPHEIEEFYEDPIDADLHYPGLGSLGASVRIKVRKGRLPWDTMNQVARCLERQVKAIGEDPSGPFWGAITSWLQMMPRDQIPPLEVEPDDIFI